MTDHRILTLQKEVDRLGQCTDPQAIIHLLGKSNISKSNIMHEKELNEERIRQCREEIKKIKGE